MTVSGPPSISTFALWTRCISKAARIPSSDFRQQPPLQESVESGESGNARLAKGSVDCPGEALSFDRSSPHSVVDRDGQSSEGPQVTGGPVSCGRDDHRSDS